MTTAGYVLFRLGDQTVATWLDDVREILRLSTIDRLPGMQPPLAGVIVLRGAPLPVLDVRQSVRTAAADDVRGDVLVIDRDGDAVGVAVDEVVSVLAPDELAEAAQPSRTLPDYVVGVRRLGDGPVLLVDLEQLLEVTATGWVEAVAAADLGAPTSDPTGGVEPR